MIATCYPLTPGRLVLYDAASGPAERGPFVGAFPAGRPISQRPQKQEDEPMGLISRFTTYIKTVFSSALDKAEDPGMTLDYAYQQQLQQLQNLRRAIAEIVTNEKRLELQRSQGETQIAKYEDQARQALAGNREDLARMALERRQQLQTQIAGFQD